MCVYRVKESTNDFLGKLHDWNEQSEFDPCLVKNDGIICVILVDDTLSASLKEE